MPAHAGIGKNRKVVGLNVSRLFSSGIIWICLAPLCYSALSVSAKLASLHLSIWHISLGRFSLGLITIPFLVRYLKLDLWGQGRFLLTLRGLFGTTGFILLVASFHHIPLSVAMTLFYLYPAFTAILSPAITGEPVPGLAWPFIGGAFIGTSLILWSDTAGGALNAGHLMAVIAAVLCALTLLLVRRLSEANNIYTLFFYLCLTGTVAGMVPLLAQGQLLVPVATAGWITVAAVALFSMGAQLSINKALTLMPASTVSVLMTVEVPLVAGFGVLYLGEAFHWRLLVGALLIFGCGIGLNLTSALAARNGR